MLSKRLTEITKLIDKNKVVHDVGSDHGLLPCFLIINGISKKAYASDNKIGPLNKAKANIEKFGLQNKVIPILADGIEKIKDDVNIITISGMGYDTVYHILDKKDLTKYDKLIIQINKNTNKLRKWISDNDYSIIDERIVYDDFYYEIVVFNTKKTRKLTDLEIEYGPINLMNRDDIFIEYLKYQRDKLMQINENVHSDIYAKKIIELNGIIKNVVF